jgi:hypothetical protein
MGEMKFSDLHDSRLVGVTYFPGSIINLLFERVDTQKVTIVLSGVVNFFCSNMLEGNIVQGIEVLEARDIRDSDLEYFVQKEARGQKVGNVRCRIMEQDLRMFLLTPSYGAESASICASVGRIDHSG